MSQSLEYAGCYANGRKTILVVEDEAAMRTLLSDVLSEAGYAVLAADCKGEVFRAVNSRSIDLITLDLTLGSEDGLEIAGEIRRSTNIPIIMITGRGEPIDRVIGLEQGADDYIAKPFHVKEVLIRVNSVLERYARPMTDLSGAGANRQQPVLRFDHHVLDGKRRLLTHADGAAINLTETEFDILAMLLENPGRILSRDEIWQALRGHEHDPLDRTLDGHVAHLRRKIEESGCSSLLIKSVRGVGYVFVGDVEPANMPLMPAEE